MNSPPESQKKIQVTRMTRIVWADPIKDLLLELPERVREIIFEHMKYRSSLSHPGFNSANGSQLCAPSFC
jgi:hypothetical protein